MPWQRMEPLDGMMGDSGATWPGARHGDASGPLPRVAELFAGIGLVRLAFERAGLRVVFANDNSRLKSHTYFLNFSQTEYRCEDVRNIQGADVPDIEIAAAPFPCTDLSLAGNMAGFGGSESSLVYEYLRVLGEMGSRRPRIATVENVVGLATSNGGEDVRAAIGALNRRGYVCEVVTVDAKHFLPQSRPRVFIVATEPGLAKTAPWEVSDLRPKWVVRLAERFPDLRLQATPLLEWPPPGRETIELFFEEMPEGDDRWWGELSLRRFRESLSNINSEREGSLADRKP